MWLKWLPWKYIVRRAARAHGFIDPFSILTRLQQFAQPSEVAEPIELLRAGAVFHARGLINTRAIQHNLDWIWPYWVVRQFDPLDDSFLPRAYSLTHINLTHRNWTAIGQPNCKALPVVDPRGLVTPLFDAWSLDSWVVLDEGGALIPSQLRAANQHITLGPNHLEVVTECTNGGMTLVSKASVEMKEGIPWCRIHLHAHSSKPGYLCVALRPYNPEGVSFIHEATLRPDRRGWELEGRPCVLFSESADRHTASDYRSGDVYHRMLSRPEVSSTTCSLGLVTAAAMFKIAEEGSRSITVEVPLSEDPESQPLFAPGLAAEPWQEVLKRTAQLQIPDKRFEFLYNSAVRTLILHSPADVYPGPYTYKRFWFRDAAFMLHALLCIGLADRAERTIDLFPYRQSLTGFFHSQDGEWDSNGEVLWILKRFCTLTGREPKETWRQPIIKGAHWIRHKRLSDDLDALHAGLMPAGFSAEHLGTNDFFYWDDFWSQAGLEAAASMAESWGDKDSANIFRSSAAAMARAIERSLERSASRRMRPGLPASPYRRMDSGAIGSLAVGYPLQLWPGNDQRLIDTVNLLMRISFVRDGFFQNMIHSGINAYLSLHVAQILLRAGDTRFFDIMRAIAGLASPTGQWPEAIHPRTGGGCMGDGQHAWAAAEWVLMIRSLFVREENGRLVLASGIVDQWIQSGGAIRFGPTPTPYGDISVSVEKINDTEAMVSWDAEWRETPPLIEVSLPGRESAKVDAAEASRAIVSLESSHS